MRGRGSCPNDTIAATFAIAELTRNNTLARTANQLRQGLTQVNTAGSPTYSTTVDAFRVQAGKAMARGDVDSDISPRPSESASWTVTCSPAPWATACSAGWPGHGAFCCVAACGTRHAATSMASCIESRCSTCDLPITRH